MAYSSVSRKGNNLFPLVLVQCATATILYTTTVAQARPILQNLLLYDITLIHLIWTRIYTTQRRLSRGTRGRV